MPTLALAFQTASDGSAMALWADLALLVIAVAIVAVAVMSGMLMLRFNRILSEIQRSTRQNFGPVSDRARSISDNVEFITQALRTDVEKLNASVRSLSDRLQHASNRMEERVEEFNALMSVVQGEAEDIFLDTASTVRGVREGARAIGGTGGSQTRRTGARQAAYPPGPDVDVRAADIDADALDLDADTLDVDEGARDVDAGPRDIVERTAPPADDSKAVSAGED